MRQIRDWYVEKGREEEGVKSSLYSKYPYLKAGTKIASQYLHDGDAQPERSRSYRL